MWYGFVSHRVCTRCKIALRAHTTTPLPLESRTSVWHFLARGAGKSWSQCVTRHKVYEKRRRKERPNSRYLSHRISCVRRLLYFTEWAPVLNAYMNNQMHEHLRHLRTLPRKMTSSLPLVQTSPRYRKFDHDSVWRDLDREPATLTRNSTTTKNDGKMNGN